MHRRASRLKEVSGDFQTPTGADFPWGRTALSGERKGGSLKNDAFGDILSVCKQKQKSWTRPFNFAPTRRVLQVA